MSERSRDSLDDAIAMYVDRLNSGERIDPLEIIASHPDDGERILERLEAFVSLGEHGEHGDIARPDDNEPLGVLGDYTLRREIGRGGMGVVYEAWQASVEREVALKVLPVGLAVDDRAFHRFLREARTAARLSHANIVAVHAMGVEAETPYYAMELVRGETLSRLLARLSALPSGAATPFGPKGELAFFASLAAVFAAVAEGLGHAHAHGVVHRDIKPSNLILDERHLATRMPRLRILDFGLATLEGQEGLTRSGDVIGTPLYMSPEQARRERVSVDHRSDIYSLGATLYEALVDRPPFRGKDHGDTLSQIVEREPLAPRRLSPRLPENLETVILKCLRKAPDDRYRTAEALAQDLRRASRGDPVEARPPSRWGRFARHVMRRRRQLAVVAGFVVLAVALVLIELGRRRAERREQEARVAGLEAQYGPAVLAVVRQLHAAPLVLRVAAGDSTRVYSFDDPRIPLVEEADFVRARHAEESIDAAVRELESIAKSMPAKRDAHYHLARAYGLVGRKDEALEAIRRTLTLAPEFLPALALRWQLEGGEDRKAARESWLPELNFDSWQRHWLDAWASTPLWKWKSRAGSATTALLALEEEPYVGCFVEAYLGRGAARHAGREYVAAQRDFVRVADRMPGIEPLLLLAKAYHEGDQEAAADRIFEEIWRGAAIEDRDDAALWIATLCYTLRDEGRGLRWADEISGNRPLRDRVRCRFLARLERVDEAIEAGRRAAWRARDDALSAIALSVALQASIRDGGRSRLWRALESLFFAHRAAQLRPDDPLAARLLKGAYERARVLVLNIHRMQAMKTKSWPGALCALTLSMFYPTVSPAQEGYWGDVRRLGAQINNGAWALNPSLGEGERTLVFTADSGTRPGGLGARDLWIARRQSTNSLFGAAANLSGVNSGARDDQGYLSDDGSTLYFSSERGTSQDLFVARWNGETYGDPQLVPGDVNTANGEAFPVISANGLELFFMRHSTVHVARRAAPNAEFDDVERLDILDLPSDEWPGSLSADGRVLFFAHTDGSSFSHIYAATRSGPGAPFDAPPVRVDLPIERGHTHPNVSRSWPASGSKLVFTSCSPCEIYEATWHQDCNANGEDDAAEIARGSVSDADGSGVPDVCERARPHFVRGLSNDDEDVDMADAVHLLGWLFSGGPAPGCLAAVNTNGDARVDISDATFLLGFLFLGGAAPVAPFPDCGPGTLPTDEALGCERTPGACD